MARLIFVTQLIDPEDPVMGFVVPQVRELSARADVLVIANEVRSVPDDLGAEVITLGKELGRNRGARGARYVSALARELHRERPLAVLAHMGPIYACLAAPFTRTAGVPLILWFAHPADTLQLRVAERCSNAVLTTFPASYPRPGPKVEAIGQAIDTEEFAWSEPRPRDGGALRLVALGRTAPVKRYDVMIRALATARRTGVDAELRIVGPSSTAADRQHRADLQASADSCAPGAVHFEDGVPRTKVAAVLHDSDVLINATASGSADKVVLEAMAAGRPVLASSPSFTPLLAHAPLPLSFPAGDSGVLAERISMMASTPAAEIERVTRALRRRIEDEHSIQHSAANVLRIASELSARRRRVHVVGE